jgi:hypothetical protein
LNAEASQPQQTRAVVRDAFDGLFYFLALFAHCIDSGLVRLKDVRYSADYYVSIMQRFNREVFERYMTTFEMTRAQDFIQLLTGSASNASCLSVPLKP